MQSVIETIKQRLPLTDVLASYITLIPAGTQFKAKCPFHNERTASFSVSPDRGLYYCFGCGAKGDMVTFVEQFEGVDFKGALKILADRAGVPLTGDYAKHEATDPIYALLEKATIRYQSELTRHPEVLEYLTKRGITAETIAAFRIGYAPTEWRFVAENLSQEEINAAEQAGLIKKTEKGYYDRFRSRIMFPLCDGSSRVVGFSGRLFPDEPDAPKYLNSPETAVFQKSRILFGFDKAKFAIKKHGFAILVEGQMDVVMSHQAGFKNTVATSGTAVSDAVSEDSRAQLAVLARLSPQIFLAFDGDAAGQKALRGAATVALALGMNPKVVPLPTGLDPADYFLQKSADEWKDLLKMSQHFIMHELNVLTTEHSSPHAAVRLLKERIFPYLAKVLSPIERNLYVEQIARELGAGLHDVAAELAAYVSSGTQARLVEHHTDLQKKQLTVLERLRGLALVHPPAQNFVDQLGALSFQDDTFVVPVMTDLEQEALRLVADHEYRTFDDDTKNALARDFFETVQKQFFALLRSKYTSELREAARLRDEIKEAQLLKTLHDLSTRRQVP